MRIVSAFTLLLLLAFTFTQSAYTENRAKKERDEERARLENLEKANQSVQKHKGDYQTNIVVNRDSFVDPFFDDQSFSRFNRFNRSNNLGQNRRRYRRSNFYDRQERAAERYQYNKRTSSQNQPRVHKPY